MGSSPRLVVALIAIVAPVALSGCIGAVTPAGVKDGDLSVGGATWKKGSETSESYVMGSVDVLLRQYEPTGLATNLFGGLMVVSAEDVWLLPEDEILPLAITNAEKNGGMTLRKVGTSEVKLEHVGETVNADLYEVDGKEVPGQALVADFYCPDTYVVAVAWGAKDGGLLGGISPFEQAKTLMSRISCDV